jgi:hypothetical protein
MWDIFSNSFKLFIKGKLFRDPSAVRRQWFIGFAIGVGVLLLLRWGGATVGLAATVASLVSGGLQPFLFKNLKYA